MLAAALALMAVPAVLYTLNPDGVPSCEVCDESGEDYGYEYPDEKDREKEDEHDAENEEPITQKEKDFSPEKSASTPNGRTAAEDEARQNRERLVQAANEFIKQEESRLAEPPKNKAAPSRKSTEPPTNTYGTRSSEQSPAAMPPQRTNPAASTTPTRADGPDRDNADFPTQNVTPKPASAKKDSDSQPRSNSAYRLRVEHQQQQLILQQQHEQYLQQLQAIRAGSPMKTPPPKPAEAAKEYTPTSAQASASAPPSAPTSASRPSAPLRGRAEPQQSEHISPRHRDHQSASPPQSATATSPPAPVPAPVAAKSVVPEPIHVPAANVRAPSPQSIQSHRTAPAAAGLLPPLPPRRREDHSSPAPLSTAAAPVAAVVSPAPTATPTVSATAYLTPREKQQRALAELRKQEDTQRNAAKVMIQEELQRALDELHAQEALQREQEQTERSKILEEQRRRELIQQSILEEKLRIERDEEQRRAERRKLQEQQRSLEDQQRLADHQAMADLLLEVERDRRSEENKVQEEQLSRVERMLYDEEQRQQEILEQLRLQNQYPYPRGHPKSNILSAIAAGNFVDTNPYPSVRSGSPSPAHSPNISPNSSMRLKPGETLAGANGSGPVAMNLNGEANGNAPANGRSSGIPTRARGTSPSPSPYHRSPTANGAPAAAAAAASPYTPTASNGRSASHLRAHAGESHTVERTERTSLEHHFEQHTRTEHHVEEHHHYQDHTYASAGKTAGQVHVTPPSKFALGHPNSQSPASTLSPLSVNSPAPGTTPSATASAAAALAASVNSRQNITNQALKEALKSPGDQDGAEETVLMQEEIELRVLHAREDLALKIDYYIRTQKKFSSAVPLKYKCAVSKVVSDCEKHRKAYNQLVGEESFKIQSLLTFMESHPRFAITGGRQMVGVTFLTPYQASDTRRVYGHFKCSKCIKYWMESGVNKSDYRSWENAYSYKDAYQACYQCDVQVYPYHQRFLKKTELNFEDRAKHDTTRCSKCEQYKRPCYEL